VKLGFTNSRFLMFSTKEPCWWCQVLPQLRARTLEALIAERPAGKAAALLRQQAARIGGASGRAGREQVQQGRFLSFFRNFLSQGCIRGFTRVHAGCKQGAARHVMPQVSWLCCIRVCACRQGL